MVDNNIKYDEIIRWQIYHHNLHADIFGQWHDWTFFLDTFDYFRNYWKNLKINRYPDIYGIRVSFFFTIFQFKYIKFRLKQKSSNISFILNTLFKIQFKNIYGLRKEKLKNKNSLSNSDYLETCLALGGSENTVLIA